MSTSQDGEAETVSTGPLVSLTVGGEFAAKSAGPLLHPVANTHVRTRTSAAKLRTRAVRATAARSLGRGPAQSENWCIRSTSGPVWTEGARLARGRASRQGESLARAGCRPGNRCYAVALRSTPG